MGLFDSLGDFENSVVTTTTLGAYNPATGTDAYRGGDSGIGSGIKKVGQDFGIGGGAPEYNQPGLSPGTAGLIYNMSKDAQSKGPQDYSNQTMSGVQPGSSGVATPDFENQNNSLGGTGADAGLGAAIKGKANRSYDMGLGKVQRQADFQGAMTNIQRASGSADMQTNLQNAQYGIDNQAGEYQLKADAARYATISGLFKGAGSVAGSSYANKHSSSGNGFYTQDSTANSFGANMGDNTNADNYGSPSGGYDSGGYGTDSNGNMYS